MARRQSTDKFGNTYTVVGCKDNGKGFAKGFVELGNTLYKIEPSMSKKEGVMVWVKITKMKKQSNFSM